MAEKHRKLGCFNCPLCNYKKVYYEDSDDIDRYVQVHVLKRHPELYDEIDWNKDEQRNKNTES